MPYLGGMQPVSQQQYGSSGPDAGPPPAARTTRSAAVGPARARTGLIVSVAVLTEIVLIAIGGNQWVADKLARAHVHGGLASGLRNAALTYSWRFTPRTSDPLHRYNGSWALIGTTIVLSALLIAAVVRGPLTFDRAFFGAWMAVPVATMIGGYVRGLVLNYPLPPHQSRLSIALFGVAAPGSTVFLAGLGLGLVVAIVVAVVGMTTKRRPLDDVDTGEIAPGPAMAPWQDRYYGPPPPHSYGGLPRDESEQTDRFPAFRADEPAQTQRLPDVGGPAAGMGAGAAVGAAAGSGAWDRGEHPQRDSDRSDDATQVLPAIPGDAAPGSEDGERTEPPREPEPPQAEQPQRAQAEPAEPTQQGADTQHRPDDRDRPTMVFPRPPDDEELQSDQ